MANSDVKKPSVFSRIGKWFRELRSECRKVVWPSRQQTIKNTTVVFAVVIIICIVVFILDSIFQFGIQALLKQFASI